MLRIEYIPDQQQEPFFSQATSVNAFFPPELNTQALLDLLSASTHNLQETRRYRSRKCRKNASICAPNGDGDAGRKWVYDKWPLYGYGAYEVGIPASFSSARLSLLDRGVVFAIAHVRGGGELGRTWYEQGRLEHKQNTFTDFGSCRDHLVSEGWADADRGVARGGWGGS